MTPPPPNAQDFIFALGAITLGFQTMLKIQQSNPLCVAASLCIFTLLGCAEKPKTVATELVEGIVTLDGQPVPGATVTFAPVQMGAGTSATGMSDSTGKYTLTAVGAGKGAQAGAGTLPGDYYVGVLKNEFPDVLGSDQPGYQPPSPDERPKEPVIKHVVPQQFNDPQKSGIKVTVKPGKNDIPITLKSS